MSPESYTYGSLKSSRAPSLSNNPKAVQGVRRWNFIGFASTYYAGAIEIPDGAKRCGHIQDVLQANTTYVLTADVGERTDIAAGG
jgi:hypothetical protein